MHHQNPASTCTAPHAEVLQSHKPEKPVIHGSVYAVNRMGQTVCPYLVVQDYIHGGLANLKFTAHFFEVQFVNFVGHSTNNSEGYKREVRRVHSTTFLAQGQLANKGANLA